MPGRELPAYLHLPGPWASGQSLTLSEEDSHYVVRVCRAAAGDRATATDGRGCVARLEIERADRAVIVRCVSVTRVARASEAWVLCGAPEDGRADWMIEKLAELGVARFRPVNGAHGTWRTSRMTRWRRLASAALRQSQQAYLLEIDEALSMEEALALVPSDASRWSARVDGTPQELPLPAPARVAGVIGPAGGWSESELDRLTEAGFRPLCLAGARLRCETAAVAWGAWWARAAAATDASPA